MTRMNREVERLRAAWASVAHRDPSIGDCPSPEMLWAAVRRELPPERTRELGLHAIACPACAEAWRLAREIAADAFPTPMTPARTKPAVPRSFAWLGWGGLTVATTALVIIAAFFTFRDSPQEPIAPGFRTPAEEPIRSLLPAAEFLSRERCVLRWEGLDGSRYEIWVATEDLGILAQAQKLEVTEYLVPNEVLETLPSGTKLLWQVKATLPDGQRLTSRTFVSTLE